MIAHDEEMCAHVGGDLPQPRLIVEGLGEAFSLAQGVEDAPKFSEWCEGIAQVEVQIDGLLTRLMPLWQVLQRSQGLLKAEHRLAVGRACYRLGTGLPEIGHGFVPDFTTQGVVRQPLDLLG